MDLMIYNYLFVEIFKAIVPNNVEELKKLNNRRRDIAYRRNLKKFQGLLKLLCFLSWSSF